MSTPWNPKGLGLQTFVLVGASTSARGPTRDCLGNRTVGRFDAKRNGSGGLAAFTLPQLRRTGQFPSLLCGPSLASASAVALPSKLVRALPVICAAAGALGFIALVASPVSTAGVDVVTYHN